MENTVVKVGMLGLGTVGGGVVRIVEGHQEDLKRQIGCPVEITKIAVRDLNKPRSSAVGEGRLTDDPLQVIDDPEIDIIIEVMGGITPTKDLILRALDQGKHIVTANKDLMAIHGKEILEKAAACRCDVLYEASVAGGIPILRILTDGFSSDRITRMMGIVNGTTNYILSKMSQDNASYDAVLDEAIRLGYAEADPTSDVEGLDAAYKMAILGRLGFHSQVMMDQVEVQGITNVTQQDIQYGKALGYEMKLLGIAERKDDFIHLSVQPTMVKNTHPLASVNGVFNAVYVYGEAVGETMFYGPGAGDMPTATSVVADLIAVSKNLMLGVNGQRYANIDKEMKVMSQDQVVCKYFLRLYVDDKAGVLNQITKVFAENEVSLFSVLQQPNDEIEHAEIIIITHDATKINMSDVLKAFEQLNVVHQIKSVYRVEE